MDYLRTAIPSQLIAERGSNLVVINPGSANIRIGLAPQDTPLNVPHCIARYTTQVPKRNVQDQLLNGQVTTAQHMEREKAYDIIASLLKIPFLDEEVANNSFPRKIGRIDGSNNPQSLRKDTSFAWTNVFEEHPEGTDDKMFIDKPVELTEGTDISPIERKYRKFICGEEALKISPDEPYCLRRPIRRGHFNVSKYYPMQQVYEDLHAIWDWLLTEKLHIPPAARYMFSALVVVPETFDNHEIKEVLSLVLRDLQFSSAVVHQEGLAAAFGNGLSTACIVSMGAQVTSVVCIEDGVALPNTEKTLPFGGEDISRCLLWTQRHHQTWPQIHTDMMAKPIDLLMLNALKDSNCYIREGEVDALAIVTSYDSIPPSTHRTRLTALNVPPMGLFYPSLFIPDVFPPPPRTWFNDYEDMLEDTWHLDYPRRPDVQESLYPGTNVGLPMWDGFPVFQAKPKKEEKVGLAEAITKSILSTGRIDLQRKLFCSIQLIGGVALTGGLIPAMEERVLHAIPSNEAIDTVEVLQSRLDPTIVSWKGGVVREASILRHPLFVARRFFLQLPSKILGVLDYGRDAWIHREDWVKNGIHLGSGRKYKDSYFVQAQAYCYINS